MRLTEEREFLVLASILDLGGHGKKREVLENIAARNYLNFNKKDLESTNSKDEQHWRVDLAFTRSRLINYRYLNPSAGHNRWEISAKGRKYFSTVLANNVRLESHFKLLTDEAEDRANES